MAELNSSLLLCPFVEERSLKSDTQSGRDCVSDCQSASHACAACVFVACIYSQPKIHSLSEFFVLQREHIMTGPFV